MRLEYKILWIEDNQDFINSVKEEICQFISQKGYKPEIKELTRVEISNINNLSLDDFDLILVDFKLSDGGYSKENGSDLIKKIRALKVFSNIVFYSSDYAAIKDLDLNGVYKYERQKINPQKIGEFYDLIEFFLNKDMNENTMRGIAMVELAKFDRDIWEILKLRSSSEDDKRALADWLKPRLRNKYEQWENLDSLELWKKIDEKGTLIFSSFDRFNYLKKQFLDRYREKHQDIFSNDEYSSIIQQRNKLAHHEKIYTLRDNKEMVEFRKHLIQIGLGLYKIKEELCNKS